MSTALYRRYRPDRFEEVIGQDHVTVPLRTALSKDRVNHAYLFSGPRGCGKTTSARILARCLNCAQGPTPTPCGQCDSCRDLATGGPGSLDVMEIDAASHGGVEDARGLRERATFAPVRDRYKILIIDEAHMVTAAGFNALLKIVEEPPEHLKFIFATTEPDKVIGTIRSRTHHYPFRLVPPEPLISYMEQLCASESTQVDRGVLPLVVRAGTGSVRDTLSVLDQLIAGAADGRVDYELAVNLLGFTPEALLDDVVDAVAADDPPTVFRVVDRVVQSGQDPRRFVEDLLDRFRDLVIARAMPDQASVVLHGVPEDQVRRLAAQAAQLSRAELSRLADVTNEALSEMVGATSPRLHLELLMARLLLPAADETQRGLAARLEALERRIDAGLVGDAESSADAVGEPSPASSRTQATPRGDSAAQETPSYAATGAGESGPTSAASLSGAALARAAMRRANEEASEPEQAAPERAAPEARRPEPTSPPQQRSQQPGQPEGPARPAPWEQPARPQEPARPEPTPAAPAPPPTSAESPSPGPSAAPAAAPAQSPAPAAAEASQVEKIRRAWPEILAALEGSSRLVWMLVKDNASVAGFDGTLLTVGFAQDGPRQSLLGRQGDRVLADAVHQVLGIRPELDLILGGDSPAHGGAQRPASPHQQERPRPKSEGRPAQEAAAPAAAPPAQSDARQEAPTSAAPSPESWGTPADVAPDWGLPEGGGDPDPWAHLPEYDPESDMEDSPGPDGWEPGPGEADRDDDGRPHEADPAGESAAAPSPDPASSVPAAGAPATPTDASVPAAAPEAAEDAPGWDVPAAEQWRPGPLVPEAEEPAIPSFARPEAELRAEFAARFGGTRPEGFGGAAASDDPAGAPAAQGAEAPTTADTSTDAPAPSGAPSVTEAVGDLRNDPNALAALGSGHPASQFPALMRRIAEGGGAEPPVNQSPSASDAEDAARPAPAPAPTPTDEPPAAGPAPGGRPDPSALAAPRDGARTGGPHDDGSPTGGSAPAPPPLDPRAASIQAAREAARGRGPARPAAPPAAGSGGPADVSAPSVDWADEVASDEDLTLEDSGLVGRKVVERLLGAKLIEEIPHG